MDAQSLPGVGLEAGREEGREHIFGYLRSGARLFDGEWKLVRYPGGTHLFNLREDPNEQDNRAGNPSCAEVRDRLDAELWAQVNRSVAESSFANRVYGSSHSSSRDFGRVGWERRYPMPWRRRAL